MQTKPGCFIDAYQIGLMFGKLSKERLTALVTASMVGGKAAPSCYWQISQSKMFQKHQETAFAI